VRERESERARERERENVIPLSDKVLKVCRVTCRHAWGFCVLDPFQELEECNSNACTREGESTKDALHTQIMSE
jgi:hypothetical protein